KLQTEVLLDSGKFDLLTRLLASLKKKVPQAPTPLSTVISLCHSHYCSSNVHHSVCLSLHFSVGESLSLSLVLLFSISVCVCLSLFLLVYLSLSLSLSLALSLLSLSLSLSVCLCLS